MAQVLVPNMLTEVVSNEIQSLGIILDFGVETRKIEPIQNVILLYLAEILIPLG